MNADHAFAHAAMSNDQFQKFSRLLTAECGIKLPPSKKTMLTGRLAKRLRALEMPSFHDYFDYVTSPRGRSEELRPMIDVVTTNKTDFFRESQHFEYLTEQVLPEIVADGRRGGSRPVRLWSAGCSTGEEPYTLSMVVDDFGGDRPDFEFSVLATDISTRVLSAAVSGIYEEEKAASVPLRLKKKYLMKSRDRKRRLVRVAPELRSRVRFRRLNFLDADYGVRKAFDVVFCRNVIIYFDRDTQAEVLRGIGACIRRGGYLFMGHSETLNGMDLPLTQVAATIYRKTA